MDWFRVYGDMPSDPKIGTLSDGEFRTWVELMCAASKHDEGGDTGLNAETVDWALRRDVTVTLPRLLERDLVTLGGNGNYIIKAWEKRQYKSDTSAERTRKYRAKLKTDAPPDTKVPVVTSQERHSDALDTEADTDTDKKEKDLSEKPDVTPTPALPNRFADFWKTYPSTSRKTAKSECEKRWKARRLDSVADKIIAHVAAMKHTRQWKDGFEPAPLTYINQRRWEDGLPDSSAEAGVVHHGSFASQDYRAGVAADGSF